MPATVIAERVGWTGSITWFRDNVRRLRPDHRPVDPADRLTWLPGDGAQCDLWFPPKKISLEDGSKTLLPVMVITAQAGRPTRLLPHGRPHRQGRRDTEAHHQPPLLSATPRSLTLSTPESPFAMLRMSPGTPTPRTTEHYDRARGSLDRHGVHFLTADVAGV